MLGFDAKAAKTVWTGACVIITLLCLFVIRKTLLLFILSIMFAYLLYPIMDFLQRRLGLKDRLPAVIILFALMISMATGAGALLRVPIRSETANLKQQIYSQEFNKNVANWRILGIPVGESIAAETNLSAVQSQLKEMMPQIEKGLSRIVRDLSNVFLVPILSFFMLKDGKKITLAVLDFALNLSSNSNERHRLAVENIRNDAHILILEYMRALVFQCLAVLIAFCAALSILNVRYALILALIAFLFEFVPLIGPLASGIVIISVCEFNHHAHIWRVLIFLVVYRLFQDYALSPYLMNKTVKLHPLVIIFGVFAGAEIGGISGVFLSLPVLALGRLAIYEILKVNKPVDAQPFASLPDPQNL